ncbi:MAG: class II aldolase/adducin family protein [Alphaproteobacteria bacterium]|jgi:ribulose-5-phosphate 4-epimerase/fuculose-1-phosphate aldolase|nr:class II aldolase/adducin family protein [Alphaproteobacteria bacterium]
MQHPPSQDARVSLAQAYGLAAHLGLDDTIFSHISLRDPKDQNLFYLPPFGALFEEVSADSLLSVPTDQEPRHINPAGFILHRTFYRAKKEIQAVVHFHSESAIAVSCQKEGLLPLSQFSMLFYERLGYHAFEGISLDPTEETRLIQSLGDHHSLLLHNHGLICVGETLGQAFMRAYYLERSCRIQLAAQKSGACLIMPPPQICAHTRDQFEGVEKESITAAYEALTRRWRAAVLR